MTEPASPPILPPFTKETARQKVQLAEDAWNTRDPDRVVLVYTENSQWRNRDEFLEGRAAIRAFLERKWQRELDVRFEYESRDVRGQWWRSHGNEHGQFDETNGLMRRRDASINDYRIEPSERRIALDDAHPEAAES